MRPPPKSYWGRSCLSIELTLKVDSSVTPAAFGVRAPLERLRRWLVQLQIKLEKKDLVKVKCQTSKKEGKRSLVFSLNNYVGTRHRNWLLQLLYLCVFMTHYNTENEGLNKKVQLSVAGEFPTSTKSHWRENSSPRMRLCTLGTVNDPTSTIWARPDWGPWEEPQTTRTHLQAQVWFQSGVFFSKGGDILFVIFLEFAKSKYFLPAKLFSVRFLIAAADGF